MARPRKNREELANELESNLGNDVSRETSVAVADADVIEDKKESKAAKNAMPDDYTLEVIADYDPSADIFRVPNKDPRYEYRFLNSEQKNLNIKTGALLYQKGGWQLCNKEHLIRIGIKESFIAPDGLYHVGEHVLAFMPKELFHKKEAAKQDKTKTRTNQIERLLKEGNPSVGGKEMHKTMKGIQPGHKLGMSSRED